MSQLSEHMKRNRSLFYFVTITILSLSSSVLHAEKSAVQDHFPDRIIVKFGASSLPVFLQRDQLISVDSELTQLLNAYSILSMISLAPRSLTRPGARAALAGLYLLKLESGSDYLSLIDQLNQSPAVEYAHVDAKVYPLETPNDPRFSEQWGMEAVMAAKAWDSAHGSANVVVAIIDSGIDLNHEDLTANFWSNPDEIPNDGIDNDGNGYIDDVNGWDFVEHDKSPNDDINCNHGTHVAGIVAAVANNGVGVAGLSWNCSLMNLRIMAYSAQAATCTGAISDSLLAISYVVDKEAQVVNMSYGHSGRLQAEEDAINEAVSEGVVMVGAAGNGGSDGIGDPASDFPGGYDAVICVGNSNHADRKDGSSNYGEGVDVFAPGSRILSTYMPSTYNNLSGTSMASPHVAGLAALLMATGVTDPQTVRDRIERGADNIDALNPRYAGMLGHGRINAYYSVIPNSLVVPIAITIDDQGGDRDFQADSGETLNLTVTFKNQSWRDAVGVSAQLVDAGLNCAIIQDASAIGDMPNKAESPNATPFVITVNTAAPLNTFITMTFRITATDWTHDETFDISLNDPRPPMPGWPKIGVTTDFNSSPFFADLNNDGNKELILCDNSQNIFVWKADGSPLAGWPATLPDSANHSMLGTPALGDVNQDGQLELVITTFRIANPDAVPPYEAEGKVFVYNAAGVLLTGWPRILSQEIKTSPALYDFNGDGKLEIIFGCYDNKVYMVDETGQDVAGWPVDVGTDVFASPAIADLDNDGETEIVIAAKDDSAAPQFGKIFVFDRSGNIRPGWPVTTPGQIYSSPALVDLDQDQDLEIVFGCGNYDGADPERSRVFALHHDGSTVDGWPVEMADTIYSSPAVGDLDKDGLPEIVLGCFDQNIYAFHHDGTLCTGWPVATQGKVYASAAIADLDSDGYAEVLIGCDDGNVYGLNYLGESLPGYPIAISGTIFPSIAVGDIDGDREVEIAAANSVGDVYLWKDTHRADRAVNWAKFRNTLPNTGLYTPSATHSPIIMMAGYWTTQLLASQAATLQVMVVAIDPFGPSDISSVDVYFAGQPTGIFLHDDGSQGDFSAADGVFGLTLSIGAATIPEGSYLLEFKATDSQGSESSLAPYLEVN